MLMPESITSGDLLLAFPRSGAPDPATRFRVFQKLHAHYVAYMVGPEEFSRIPRLNTDPEITAIEEAWLAWEDRQVDVDSLPTTPEEFRAWFLETAAQHGQPDFCQYLIHEATLEEMAYFYMGEELVDSKFDDLMAMVQIGTEGHTKLTIAENYWDEMGGGELDKMHTRMFEHLAKYMRGHLDRAGIDFSDLNTTEVYENASLLLIYGIHRHLTPRALGAMGVLEHSSPPRFQAMVDGCRRLGVPEDVVDYPRVHVHVDADHGDEWFKGVFMPFVGYSPELLREISMGIATRVRVANAYYNQIWASMRALSKGNAG
jgi:Iron-containing redox enzyme